MRNGDGRPQFQLSWAKALGRKHLQSHGLEVEEAKNSVLLCGAVKY